MGLAVFHELLMYSEFVSCYRPSFPLLNFEISGFLTIQPLLLEENSGFQNQVAPTQALVGTCTEIKIVYKCLGGPSSPQFNLAKAKVVFRAFELDY